MRTFFGLPQIKGDRDLTSEESSLIAKAKRNLYREIWNLCYGSRGGIEWITIYNMPTWVRRMNIQFLNKDTEEENKRIKSSQGQPSSKTMAKPPKPYRH